MRKTCRILLLVLAAAATVACASAPTGRSTDPTAAGRRSRRGTSDADSDRISASKRHSVRASSKQVTDGNAGASFAELEALSSNAKVKTRLTGQATYYADSLAGNHMASGERYDPRMPHAAHRTLPFGTLIRVTRLSNGATVVLRVTDRGPFGSRRRILDVSRAAAERLGMIRAGVADVQIEVLSKP